MNSVAVLNDAIAWGHEMVELVMVDVTPEQAHTAPPGMANSIAAIYAHALLSEDGVVNGLLRGLPPMFAADMAGKTGVANPQMNLDPSWARAVQVDLSTLRQYGQTVLAAVTAYVGSLSEADLDRVLDLSQVGLGHRTVGWALHALVAGHLNNMAGELSCLKGLQGLRGYPF